MRRCMALRQQVGARLEVLASLADKQIAIEDESSAVPVKAQDKPVAQVAAKKVKSAPVAQARQPPAQSKSKPAPAPAAATPARSSAASSDSSNGVQTPAIAAAPISAPTSFPEPPMPTTTVAAQQFGALIRSRDRLLHTACCLS